MSSTISYEIKNKNGWDDTRLFRSLVGRKRVSNRNLERWHWQLCGKEKKIKIDNNVYIIETITEEDIAKKTLG